MDAKTKLVEYYRDSLQIGALKGFHYFEIRVRGREELEMKLFPYQQHGITRPLLKLQSSSLIIPPASPTPTRKDNQPVFLLAAYQKYKAPFVWMRSNHHLLARTIQNFDYQQPLKLDATQKWDNSNIHLFQIIDEVVQLFPCENPFKVNQRLFKDLAARESALYSGAMIHFLLEIYDFFPSYQAFIKEDLRFLHLIHFEKILYKTILISRDDSKTEAIRC